jgi:hypothetical protein
MPENLKHKAILKLLLDLKPDHVEKVWLVSRLNNPALLGGGGVATAYVFIPDLHVISHAAEARYKYGFGKMGDGRPVDREALLDKLAQSLRKTWIKWGRRQTMVTLQLGDSLDLWRENHAKEQDVQSMIRTIQHDHAAIQNRLLARGAGSLNARLLMGNHEYWGSDGTFRSIDMARAKSSRLLKIGAKRSVLATHGDLFDPLERKLPDLVQGWFVRNFGPLAKMKTYTADRGTGNASLGGHGGYEGGPPRELSHPDQSAALPDWVNVWQTNAGASDAELKQSHELMPLARKAAAGLRQGRAASLKEMDLTGHGPLTDLRTLVIGHSHWPRLCVHLDGARPQNNLVLADCGAWIEALDIGGRVVPSCQVGVMCGGDMRIYQLDIRS